MLLAKEARTKADTHKKNTIETETLDIIRKSHHQIDSRCSQGYYFAVVDEVDNYLEESINAAIEDLKGLGYKVRLVNEDSLTFLKIEW